MLLAMLKAQWTSLARDKVALFLLFILPIIFFSVFAFIFGGSSGEGSKPADLKVGVLDLDNTKASQAIADSLFGLSGVVASDAASHTKAETIDEKEINRLVRNNTLDAAVLLPKGFEDSVADFGGERPAVKVIYDSANPMAENMLSGVLQGAAFTAVPDVLIEKSFEQFRTFGGPFSAQQTAAVGLFKNMLGAGGNDVATEEATDGVNTGDDEAEEAAQGNSGLSMTDGLIKIETVSAQNSQVSAKNPKRAGSIIAYYAASTAVMFLMFSMAGSASVLLEYQENGTLERLISGQMSVSQLLFSHWVFFVLCGIAQLIVMFTFAVLAFGIDLSSSSVLLGTLTMTIVTSMASASFVIMLATLCRSRKQLESISTTIILIMSAFGGSMIPRPFLPEFIRDTSNLTFNGWALDGFLKVLWYYDPSKNILATLQWHILVILVMSAVFLYVATLRAKKWAVA